MTETVLVTGATGFIGRALAKRLAASGLKVRCLVRQGSDISRLPPGMEITRGDLLDPASLEAAVRGAAQVWHLAALVRPAGVLVSRKRLEERFYSVNAAATGLLAGKAARAGVKRFIYFSSVSALGPGVNLRDDAEPRPLTLYGKSKLAGEAALKEAARAGLDYIILRPSMIYGPGSPGWTPLFDSVRRGKVLGPGDCGNTFSVCYLENLLDAALLAAQKAPAGSALNVSEGSMSVRELFLTLGSLTGKRPVIIGLPVNFLRAFSSALEGLLSLAGLYMPGLIAADRSRVEEACASWSHGSEQLRSLGWRPAVATEKGLAASLGGGP